MRKYLSLLAFMLATNILFAQIPGSTSLTATQSVFMEKKVVYKKNTTTTYEQNATSHIGMAFTQYDSTTKTYRSIFEFSLANIPANATITSARIYYSMGGSSYSFKLTSVSSVSSNNDQANFSAAGSGTALESSLTYGNNNKLSVPFKTEIQNNLPNRKMYIGGVSNSEATSGSTSSLSLTIDVAYTRPPETVNFTARNDMDGFIGGHIGVGINAAATDRSSPFTTPASEGQTVNVQAYDTGNFYSGYTYLFNDSEAASNKSLLYRKNGADGYQNYGNTSTGTHTLKQGDSGLEFVAKLSKSCNVSVSAGNYPVYVNGQAYSSTAYVSVIQFNTISLQCDPIFSQNGQMQFFSHWNNNGTPVYQNTVMISAHSPVTAVYSNRPVYNGFKQVFFGQTVGQPIEVYWTENPNTQITEYEIWRRVKSNGVLGPETKIATVGRGVQLHTDYDYNLTDGYSDKLILYDVREHNTVTGGYSSPAYETVYGTTGDLSKKAIKDQIASNEVPTEYSIGNYPNPFNPTTTINYQLPKDGLVTIKIYDIIGKEVATLVNGHKSAGYYKVDFDASRMTSGVYICSIQASSFSKSIKLLLTK